MAPVWALILLEVGLEAFLVASPAAAGWFGASLDVDLDLRTRQGRSPADFWLDGWVFG